MNCAPSSGPPSAALRALLCVFALAIAWNRATGQEGGYAGAFSVQQGGEVAFHVSTASDTFNLSIYKWGSLLSPVARVNGVAGGLQALPELSYASGCGWRESCRLRVPSSWAPGMYEATFPTSRGTGAVFFPVRPRIAGSASRTAVLLNVSTWQGYNNFGGKSLYSYNSTDSVSSPRVSFERPYAGDPLVDQYFKWEALLIRWLEDNGLPFELITGPDLDREPGLLDAYDLLIVSGHSEYWTRRERESVERFVAAGNRLVIFSGNTSWWQARIEDSLKTLVCYRSASRDPLAGIVDSLVTVNWFAPPVSQPENWFTGVSFRNGGLVASGDILPRERGFGDYGVVNSHHWVYEGTGLEEGSEFGWENGIVGYETDGALFTRVEGIPVPTGADGSPLNYRILGVSPAANVNGTPRGHATMGIYFSPNGGPVFNAATTGWVHGLAGDTTVQRITLNVLRRFASNRFPPDIVEWAPARLERGVVNGEAVDINRREILVAPGDSVAFRILAVEPYGSPVWYYFSKGGAVVSSESKFVYHAGVEDRNRFAVSVTAGAYNTHDTARIGWTVFYVPLKILTPSVPILRQWGDFRLHLNVLNYYRDTLRYELADSPGWLSVGEAGVISGTAPGEGGSFTVRVRVTNRHDDSDEVAFKVDVLGPTGVHERSGAPAGITLLRNFPNPFNPSTRLEFRLDRKGDVSADVYSVSGELVRRLMDRTPLEAGTHNLQWDGALSTGEGASSGVYFYRIVLQPRGGTVPVVASGKMLLIR